MKASECTDANRNSGPSSPNRNHFPFAATSLSSFKLLMFILVNCGGPHAKGPGGGFLPALRRGVVQCADNRRTGKVQKLVARAGFEPATSEVMSLASYRAALPRETMVSGIPRRSMGREVIENDTAANGWMHQRGEVWFKHHVGADSLGLRVAGAEVHARECDGQ